MCKSFKSIQDSLFRNYYEKYYCEDLEKLVVSFIPKESKHTDAFSIISNCIFYDFLLVEKFGLSVVECYSCIAHEVGHFVSPPREVESDQNEREFHADQYVVGLGLADHLISALKKMCPDDELTMMRIEKMSSINS